MQLKQILMLSLGFAVCAVANAQTFPTRTIRAIVPYAPGGSTDVVMRILAPRMAEILGQQVVVENRPGGSSTIGLDIAAKSPPDGHTIGIANITFCANPSLIRKMPFDSEKDLLPVSLLSIVVDRDAGTVGSSISSRKISEGVDRAGQVATGGDELRVGRQCQRQSPCHRAFQFRHRHQDDARAV